MTGPMLGYHLRVGSKMTATAVNGPVIPGSVAGIWFASKGNRTVGNSNTEQRVSR